MSLDQLNKNFGPTTTTDLESKIIQDLEKRIKLRGADVAAEIAKALADANDLNEMH